MDGIERYALDIEKIATGAGSIEERGCAVDIKIDDCFTDLSLDIASPMARAHYVTNLCRRLDRLRAVVDAEARPALDRALTRLQQGLR